MVSYLVNGIESTYYINKTLVDKWDKLKTSLVKRDEDRVFIVDGRERSGKSVFAIQQAAYINPSILQDKFNGKVLPSIPFDDSKSVDWILENDKEWLNEAKRRYNEGSLLPNVCFTPNELIEAIRKAQKGDVINFDEAFRGLSSRGALSKVNKMIVQALMEMGQKNLIVFIISPSFFMLDLYAAMLRSNALFHIEREKGTNKRYFKVYNYKKKAKLYQHGVKKGWEYKIPSKFKDYFFNIYPAGKDFELRYRLKKKLALETMDDSTPEASEDSKFMLQRNYLIKYCAKKLGISLRDMEKEFSDMPFALKKTSYSDILTENTENVRRSPSSI